MRYKVIEYGFLRDYYLLVALSPFDPTLAMTCSCPLGTLNPVGLNSSLWWDTDDDLPDPDRDGGSLEDPGLEEDEECLVKFNCHGLRRGKDIKARNSMMMFLN